MRVSFLEFAIVLLINDANYRDDQCNNANHHSQIDYEPYGFFIGTHSSSSLYICHDATQPARETNPQTKLINGENEKYIKTMLRSVMTTFNQNIKR
jgi:hypothetical protein